MLVSFGEDSASVPTQSPQSGLHPIVKLAIAGGLAYFLLWSLGPGHEPLPQHGKK